MRISLAFDRRHSPARRLDQRRANLTQVDAVVRLHIIERRITNSQFIVNYSIFVATLRMSWHSDIASPLSPNGDDAFSLYRDHAVGTETPVTLAGVSIGEQIRHRSGIGNLGVLPMKQAGHRLPPFAMLQPRSV